MRGVWKPWALADPPNKCGGEHRIPVAQNTEFWLCIALGILIAQNREFWLWVARRILVAQNREFWLCAARWILVAQQASVGKLLSLPDVVSALTNLFTSALLSTNQQDMIAVVIV